MIRFYVKCFHNLFQRYILLSIWVVMFINQGDCHPMKNGNNPTNDKQVIQSDNGNTEEPSSAARQKLQSLISDNGYVINRQLQDVLSQYFHRRYKILPVFKIDVNVFENIPLKMTSSLRPTSDSELLLDREDHLRHGFKRSMQYQSIISKIHNGVPIVTSLENIGSFIPFAKELTVLKAKNNSDDSKFEKYSKIEKNNEQTEKVQDMTHDRNTGTETEEDMKPVSELVEFINKKPNEFEIDKQNSDDDEAAEIVFEMTQNVKDLHKKSSTAEELFRSKLENPDKDSKSSRNILRSPDVESLENTQKSHGVKDQMVERGTDIEVAIHTGDSPKKLYKIVRTKIIELAPDTDAIPEKLFKQIVPNDTLESDTKLSNVDVLHSNQGISQLQQISSPSTVETVELTEGKVINVKNPKFLPMPQNPKPQESRPIEVQEGKANVNVSTPELFFITPGNISKLGIIENNETDNIQTSPSELSAGKNVLESQEEISFQDLQGKKALPNKRTNLSKILSEQLALVPPNAQYQYEKSTQGSKSDLHDLRAEEPTLELREPEHDKTIDHKKNSFDDIKFEELLSPPNKDLEGKNNNRNSKADSNLAIQEHMSAEKLLSESLPIKELEMKKTEVSAKRPPHMIEDSKDDEDKATYLSVQPDEELPLKPRAIKEFQDMPAKTKTWKGRESESEQTIYNNNQPVSSVLKAVPSNEELRGKKLRLVGSSKKNPTFSHHGVRSQSREKVRHPATNDDVDLTNEQLLRYLENDRLQEIVKTRESK